ncbi:hypothetical protein BC629DRAFT_1467173 [Irpex lacteus]|nr:hypothetical protein BC629DRAFT_1467173 [Irpex lacteus]
MSSSASTSKLTKKQKKALAYRERQGKGKGKASALGGEDEEENDVPVMEDQDIAEAQVEAGAVEGEESGKKGSGRVEKVVDGGKKKRKREDVDEDKDKDKAKGKKEQKGVKTKKKRKVEGGGGVGADGEGDGDGGEAESKSNQKGKAQRFILFVGNLKYTTTKETIREHFAKACSTPPEVRLMTPKPQPGRTVAKSKGCAFLEFTSKPPLQEALKLHHSTIEGRQINVELTAGGGGKSEVRLAKVKERNKELHEQRKKKLEKQKKTLDVEAEVRDLERPQRYSATSGVDQAPAAKRTWSIPDEKEAETRTRGKKKSKRPAKPFGTGVNAIPVG